MCRPLPETPAGQMPGAGDAPERGEDEQAGQPRHGAEAKPDEEKIAGHAPRQERDDGHEVRGRGGSPTP